MLAKTLFQHRYHGLICLTHPFHIKFHLLPVIGHQPVHFDLHVRGLGVDSGRIAERDRPTDCQVARARPGETPLDWAKLTVKGTLRTLEKRSALRRRRRRRRRPSRAPSRAVPSAQHWLAVANGCASVPKRARGPPRRSAGRRAGG